MPIRRLRPRLVLPLWAAAAVACGGSDLVLPSGDDGSRLQVVQGNEQVGTPGTPLDDPLIVRVVDTDGNGVAGQPVTWVVGGGGGAIDPAAVTTNAEGLAFAEWILGPSEGLNTVEAQAPGSAAVTFTAMAREDGGGGPGPLPGASRVVLVEGNAQTAPVGSRVAIRPAVKVTDSGGAPVPGVEVNFVVTGGAGSVDGATQVTGADGIARVGAWRLSPSPGSNTLEARAGSLEGSPVVFTAEGTALEGEVSRLVYRLAPGDVKKNEPFTVAVALVDARGALVPLEGILVYVGLFPEGSENPNNRLLSGTRFRNTEAGIATFDLSVTQKGRYRLRALTDDLPQLGPHGPEPYLFSQVFEVK